MTTISLGAKTPAPPNRAAARTRKIVARSVVGGLLALYGVISVYPFLWMISAAFKDSVEVTRGGHLIPEHPTFDTIVDTWNKLHFFDFFVNSLLVTLYTVALTVVIYAAAGYAFAILRFPGKGFFQKLFVSLLFVPGVTVMLPIVLLENNMGILGTHLGLVLPFVNGGAPLSILLMTGAFRSVPGELRDSARVDGASEFRIFRSVYLPLARPALITVALLTAIPTWNEFLLTRVSLNDPSTYTLPLGLQTLSAENVPHYNNLMAGALIVVIPVIILFLTLQRYFVNGLVGAVKG